MTTRPGATLSKRQRDFVELIAAGSSLPTAATVLAIHRGTAWRWSRDLAVQRAVAETEDDIRAQARRRARIAAVEAVDVLQTIIHDTSVQPSVRVRAARGLAALFAQLEPKQLTADVTATLAEQPAHDGPTESFDEMLDRVAENLRATTDVERRPAAVTGNGSEDGP